jgi:hypothetical protein
MPPAPSYGADAAASTDLDDPAAEQIISNLNASGRNTMFCCLSCGMPFSFPDDSYTSGDSEVKAILQFVHTVRREVRRDDRSKASTMQWQVNKSHYLHRFLHGNIIRHVTFVDQEHLQRVFKYNRLMDALHKPCCSNLFACICKSWVCVRVRMCVCLNQCASELHAREAELIVAAGPQTT